MNELLFRSQARERINLACRKARAQQAKRSAMHRYLRQLFPQQVPPLVRMPEHGPRWAP